MTNTFQIIPALDLIDGRVVRLTRGDFATARVYGDPLEIVRSWKLARGTRLHVVDLLASRDGAPIELDTIRTLADEGLDIQVGGGIRSVSDAMRWIEAGAAKVIVGTTAAESFRHLELIAEAIGASRMIVAADVDGGVVRTRGWTHNSSVTIDELAMRAESIGIRELLVTEVSRDGTLLGPACELYRRLSRVTSLSLIASGGIATSRDLDALARIDGVGSAVVGRALLENRIELGMAQLTVGRSTVPERVIPCLDMHGGRVVKGVRFQSLRDAGDPVELAMRYEKEGADEIVVLDVSATTEERATSLETVRRIADALFIPLTVGGGVRTIDDFRALLRAGADRVAINSAAIADPSLIHRCADEFGVQAVVLACDARRDGERYEVVSRAATTATSLDAAEWCATAEFLGAGEILLTSIDRDGTQQGFDIELLRSVVGHVDIGVIASGGAGRLQHFAEAIESGGASAVLAASLFHDGVLSIGEVKTVLKAAGIQVREASGPKAPAFGHPPYGRILPSGGRPDAGASGPLRDAGESND